MADQKFQPGDEVQLKSGGPRMTVVGYDVYEPYETEKKYKCRWFSEKNQLTEGIFSEPELKLAASASGGGVKLERG